MSKSCEMISPVQPLQTQKYIVKNKNCYIVYH